MGILKNLLILMIHNIVNDIETQVFANIFKTLLIIIIAIIYINIHVQNKSTQWECKPQVVNF